MIVQQHRKFEEQSTAKIICFMSALGAHGPRYGSETLSNSIVPDVPFHIPLKLVLHTLDDRRSHVELSPNKWMEWLAPWTIRIRMRPHDVEHRVRCTNHESIDEVCRSMGGSLGTHMPPRLRRRGEATQGWAIRSDFLLALSPPGEGTGPCQPHLLRVRVFRIRMVCDTGHSIVCRRIACRPWNRRGWRRTGPIPSKAIDPLVQEPPCPPGRGEPSHRTVRKPAPDHSGPSDLEGHRQPVRGGTGEGPRVRPGWQFRGQPGPAQGSWISRRRVPGRHRRSTTRRRKKDTSRRATGESNTTTAQAGRCRCATSGHAPSEGAGGAPAAGLVHVDASQRQLLPERIRLRNVGRDDGQSAQRFRRRGQFEYLRHQWPEVRACRNQPILHAHQSS